MSWRDTRKSISRPASTFLPAARGAAMRARRAVRSAARSRWQHLTGFSTCLRIPGHLSLSAAQMLPLSLSPSCTRSVLSESLSAVSFSWRLYTGRADYITATLLVGIAVDVLTAGSASAWPPTKSLPEMGWNTFISKRNDTLKMKRLNGDGSPGVRSHPTDRRFGKGSTVTLTRGIH